MIRAAVHMCVFAHLFSVLSGVDLGVEFQGQSNSMFKFLKKHHTVPFFSKRKLGLSEVSPVSAGI